MKIAETQMERDLKQAGFTKELIAWSFTPIFYKQANGYYWSKKVPYKNGCTDTIEIGVIINQEYKSMEVYACDCVVGCCGRNMGIHPFSIDKVNSLLADEVKWLDDIYQQEINNFSNKSFTNDLIETLKEALKYQFPKIENFMIERDQKDGRINIIFNEGIYSKEEVEKYIHDIIETKI